MQGMARTWDSRVGSWDAHVHTDPAFAGIRTAVLEAAAPQGYEDAVDLGAGNGFLTLPLAAAVAHITAVDVSPAMITALDAAARQAAQANITTVVADLRTYDAPAGSLDLVVSSYALHHLSDPDKIELLQRARGWLRPGGRLVIADMMFGRGGTQNDRAIILAKVASLARRGPAGWWRILKNLVRFGLRIGSEQPANPEFWQRQAGLAGFQTVSYRSIVAEAGLLVATVGSAHTTQPAAIAVDGSS